MKKMMMLMTLAIGSMLSYAQIDKDQLALAISKADAANTEKLKEYIWKRKSVVSVEGVVKLTTLTEFSFDADGKLQTKMTDAKTDVKKKPGLRGRAQENAAEDKLDYIEKALALSLSYHFMSKGELIDFFSKATVTERGDQIEATAENVHVKGDKLTIWVDAATHLFVKKTFSSLLDKDPISGEINYAKFESGINHGTTTVLNMPVKKMKIDATNQDYSKRVK